MLGQLRRSKCIPVPPYVKVCWLREKYIILSLASSVLSLSKRQIVHLHITTQNSGIYAFYISNSWCGFLFSFWDLAGSQGGCEQIGSPRAGQPSWKRTKPCRDHRLTLSRKSQPCGDSN